MISNLKNIQPFIHFGFGITEITVPSGATVTVWLNTLFNQDMYVFNLQAYPALVTKISDYEYSVTQHNPGTYKITLSINPKQKKTSLESNIITLNVTEQNGEGENSTGRD